MWSVLNLWQRDAAGAIPARPGPRQREQFARAVGCGHGEPGLSALRQRLSQLQQRGALFVGTDHGAVTSDHPATWWRAHHAGRACERSCRGPARRAERWCR